MVINRHDFLSIGQVQTKLCVANNCDIAEWACVSRAKDSLNVFVEADNFDTSGVLLNIIVNVILFVSLSVLFCYLHASNHVGAWLLRFNIHKSFCVVLLFSFDNFVLKQTLLHLYRANKDVRVTVLNYNQLFRVEEINVAAGGHVNLVNLVTCYLIVDLKNPSVEYSDVPVFVAAASQKESDLVINFLKADFVEGLHTMKSERLNFTREDVVV